MAFYSTSREKKEKSNENFNYFKCFASVKLISWKLLNNYKEQFLLTMVALRSNKVCIKLKALIYFFFKRQRKRNQVPNMYGIEKPKKSGTQEKKITDR